MSLKNLIALQRGQQAGVKDETPQGKPAVRGEVAAAESPHVDDDSTVAEPVASDAAPAPAADAPKRSGLGLNLVGAGRAVGGAVRPRTPANPVAPRRSAVDGGGDSGKDDGAGFTLDDLAGFDANDDSAPSRPTLATPMFDDEIEATAPDRVLDPMLDKQQMAFVESLDGIYPVLHDPEMFGQAVRIIMLELQEHPEYKPLLADQDVHTMIRGMRSTMGLARIRKQEKSRKTGTAGKRAARGKSAVSDEDMALLDSVMGGFSDD